jgi:hypothetical protein
MTGMLGWTIAFVLRHSDNSRSDAHLARDRANPLRASPSHRGPTVLVLPRSDRPRHHGLGSPARRETCA